MRKSGFRARLEELMAGEKPFPWADRVGLTPGVFTRMWNEGAPPKADSLEKIADATGASIDWLLTGEGPKWRKDMGMVCEGEVQYRPVNEGLMVAVVAAIEEFLEAEDLTLRPEKKGELIALIYEMAAEEGKGVDKARVMKLIRLVA
jgi:transcriptional regulator with XRE-family HTH domain